MFNDVAIILINKFGIEGEVTTPSTLGLSLEVDFADHVFKVGKALTCDHNIDTLRIRCIVNINDVTACLYIHKLAQCALVAIPA